MTVEYEADRVGFLMRCARLLMDNFPEQSLNKISECAEEWVAKGNVTTHGLLSYFRAYFL